MHNMVILVYVGKDLVFLLNELNVSTIMLNTWLLLVVLICFGLITVIVFDHYFRTQKHSLTI